MAKLHELLAIDSNLKNQADKTRTELRKTFTDKKHLFSEKRVVTTPLAEGGKQAVEIQNDLQTKVVDELTWLSGHLAKSIDVSNQISLANQKANADIILEDGTVLLKSVPATTLLELEKRVNDMVDIISAVPTLDPSKGFTPDPDRGAGVYKARDIEKTRTQKAQRPIVLYDATKEHPAQTQLISVDEPVAKLEEQEWSSCLTISQKSQLFDQAGVVLRAIKKARSRANDIEVDTDKRIGATLTKAIFGI